MNKAECLQFFGVDDIMNLPKEVERVIQLPTDEQEKQKQVNAVFGKLFR